MGPDPADWAGTPCRITAADKSFPALASGIGVGKMGDGRSFDDVRAMAAGRVPMRLDGQCRPRFRSIEAKMELVVRAVRPDDASELADLLNHIIARGGTTALEQPFTAEALAAKFLTGPEVICCFVAIDPVSGRLEGWQTLLRNPSLPETIGDIGTFARMGSTRRGVGSALFAATRAEARQQGLAAINATIRADNTGGLAFYSRMGFVDHAVQSAVPLQDGTLVDRISQRYRLDIA